MRLAKTRDVSSLRSLESLIGSLGISACFFFQRPEDSFVVPDATISLVDAEGQYGYRFYYWPP